MMHNHNTKEIIPVKVIIDTDLEISATNFYGTSKTGKSYVAPQLVFIKALARQKKVDSSFPFGMIDQIISSLQTIHTENNEYFED